MNRFRTCFIILTLSVFAFALSLCPAATTSVSILGSAKPYYSPASTLIHVGDSIKWTNSNSTTHTATSNSGLWDSGHLADGASYTFTFNTVGTYPYHCTIHTFMRATVYVVLAPDTTPPNNVTNFTADGGDSFVQLGWKNPTDVDFVGTKVLRKTGGYPSGPNDGSATLVTQSAASSFIDSGVTDGNIYYYGAFSYDTASNFASGSFAVALPHSLSTPTLSKLPDIRLNIAESLNPAFNLNGFNTGGVISNYTVLGNFGGAAVDNLGNISYTSGTAASLGFASYGVSNTAGSQTTANVIKYSTYRFATTQNLRFYVDHGTVLGNDKGDTTFNLADIITPVPTDSVYFYALVIPTNQADTGKVVATLSNVSILNITLPTNDTLTGDVPVYVYVSPDSTMTGTDFDTLIVHVTEILHNYSQFNQSSDTAQYAYQPAPGATAGYPNINWLPTYNGATGVVQFSFTTAGQGVKWTLLRPNWIPSIPGQWYTLRLRVTSDNEGVNSLSPLAFVYSGDPAAGPTEVSGITFFSIPTTKWITLQISVLAEDTAGLYPQLIMRNGSSLGSIYLDYVDIFAGKPGILEAKGSVLSGPPGGTWTTSTALNSWAFEPPFNFTQSSYAVSTGSLDVAINGSNQGVKVTGISSPGFTYTQAVSPKQSVGMQAQLSSSGSVTNPVELLVLLGDTTAGGQGIEELGATAAIFRVPVQNNGLFLLGYNIITNPFIYPQFQVKGSGTGHIFVGDTQVLLDNDIPEYFDDSLLPS